MTTDFKDKFERVYNRDPDWDDNDFGPDEPEEYYDILKEGDGQIALNLTSIMINK